MGLQNKRIYEISSKLNGKVVKYTGKIFWGGISQEEFWKKNENLQNAIAKQAYIPNFIQIGQWESGQI